MNTRSNYMMPAAINCCLTCAKHARVEEHPLVNWCILHRELVSTGGYCDRYEAPPFTDAMPPVIRIAVVQ